MVAAPVVMVFIVIRAAMIFILSDQRERAVLVSFHRQGQAERISGVPIPALFAGIGFRNCFGLSEAPLDRTRQQYAMPCFRGCPAASEAWHAPSGFCLCCCRSRRGQRLAGLGRAHNQTCEAHLIFILLFWCCTRYYVNRVRDSKGLVTRSEAERDRSESGARRSPARPCGAFFPTWPGNSRLTRFIPHRLAAKKKDIVTLSFFPKSGKAKF